MAKKVVKHRVQFDLLPESKRFPQDKALALLDDAWKQEGHGQYAAHHRRGMLLEAGLESPALYAMVKELLERVKAGAVTAGEVTASPQQQAALEGVIDCEPASWNL